jgi:hypothetical protein
LSTNTAIELFFYFIGGFDAFIVFVTDLLLPPRLPVIIVFAEEEIEDVAGFM